MKNNFKFFILILAILALFGIVQAEEEITISLPSVPVAQEASANTPQSGFDPLRYTLGPDDIVEVSVMRHPEFSGIYPINLEGKLQYKFVGDIDVNGLTKKQLEDKLKEVVSVYVINPEINVAVVEYKSKVIYVLGEVAKPGKYYMRSETIPVREAVVQAGLPTLAAAMRKCRIITPDNNGNMKTRAVDLYAVLYGGNLKYNYDMRPGDVLYVPSTVMAKIVRIINPVTATVSGMSAAPEGASTAKSAISNLVTK
ncbi:MAG: polysaccharide biosynthesis/export family protein [Candidatus Omnitrophota bacterium]